MQITIESQHLTRVHVDRALLDYVGKIPKVHANFSDFDGLFPTVSGRALRSLLLNAPTLEPELNTPTFEEIAHYYTPMRLHPVYHGLVLDQENSIDELTQSVEPIFGFYRNRRIGLPALVALLYVLVSMRDTWKLTDRQREAIDYYLWRVAYTIQASANSLMHLESTLEPVRALYIRRMRDQSKPDEIIVVVDAVVYAAYLKAGYTEAQLIKQVGSRDTASLYVSVV